MVYRGGCGSALDAERLAVVLHRMWVDGSEFRWSKDSAAVPAVA
jgi:hypothetical protein